MLSDRVPNRAARFDGKIFALFEDKLGCDLLYKRLRT